MGNSSKPKFEVGINMLWILSINSLVIAICIVKEKDDFATLICQNPVIEPIAFPFHPP
jgi:hypothetical protein